MEIRLCFSKSAENQQSHKSGQICWSSPGWTSVNEVRPGRLLQMMTSWGSLSCFLHVLKMSNFSKTMSALQKHQVIFIHIYISPNNVNPRCPPVPPSRVSESSFRPNFAAQLVFVSASHSPSTLCSYQGQRLWRGPVTDITTSPPRGYICQNHLPPVCCWDLCGCAEGGQSSPSVLSGTRFTLTVVCMIL